MTDDKKVFAPGNSFCILSSLVACDGIPFLGKQYTVIGVAMEPTLHDGERVTASSVNRELQRGDIVVYTRPDSNDAIKRIIGLPGETIEVKGGQVYIDGTELEEPYLMEQGQTILEEPLLIPEGYYFVMGDNRKNSYDSRIHGPIAEDSITGIVNR